MRNFRLVRLASRALLFVVVALSANSNAQDALTPVAGEYNILGTTVGDQVGTSVSLDSDGGWMVWSDNATDGDGAGVSACQLDSTFVPTFSSFRINQKGQGEQEKPSVAALQNGGAVFVWQGGPLGFQDVYARIIDSSGTFISGEFIVNTFTNGQQGNAVVKTLSNGNVVVVWTSQGQDGSMSGVYGQLLSPTGVKINSEFAINQTTSLNQRSPSVAVLENGNFVVAWVTEVAKGGATYDVNVLGRIYTSSGTAVSAEFPLTATSLASAPALVGVSGGGFLAVWGQNDGANAENGWDVFSRPYTASGTAAGPVVAINTHLVGDQFAPKIAHSQGAALVVWSSLAQDGSFEGVFARQISADGTVVGSEIPVNTTTKGKQIQPAVGANTDGAFFVVWSSLVGGAYGFDLFGQRFALNAAGSLLPTPGAPYAAGLSVSQISVTWPEVLGYSVAFYEVYVDGATTPVTTVNNFVTMSNFVAGSSHSFRILYQLTDGRRSALSPSVTGRTWGVDSNGDGLSDDWQVAVWGDSSNWQSATQDSDGDGASNFAEFLAGTNPMDSSSVLRTRMSRSDLGIVFSWNSQPGFVYQIQQANNLTSWQNVGSARFAHGTVDSVVISGVGQSTFYRVIRLR